MILVLTNATLTPRKGGCIILYCITGLALLLSFAADRGKTRTAVARAVKRFGRIMPALFIMLAVVSCVPVQALATALFKVTDHFCWAVSLAAASLAGAFMMLPGFIVYPLCGIFAENGTPYYLLSAMTTTMMMVGVVTFPVEASCLGVKPALARNLSGLMIAVTVAVVTGLWFGEF